MIEKVPTCPKCVLFANVERTCCAPGAAWSGKCGSDDDPNAEYTWAEGFQACLERTEAARAQKKSKYDL